MTPRSLADESGSGRRSAQVVLARLHLVKTGAKVILLDDAAAALLAGLPREGPWVFPSRTHAGLLLRDIRKTWWRILERGEFSAKDKAGLEKLVRQMMRAMQ